MEIKVTSITGVISLIKWLNKIQSQSESQYTYLNQPARCHSLDFHSCASVLCSKGNFTALFHFPAAGVKCPVVAVERLHALLYSAVYIFNSFGIIEPIPGRKN